jgi:ATP-dependent Clp protease ATP-binding subunit ClpC
MEFLSWHYSKGIDYYLKSWSGTFDWVNHFFSPPLLLRTLFAPWKRLIIEDKGPGFNFQKFFEVVSFNLISRGIGATVRFTLFWVGLVLIALSFFGGAVGFMFWLLLPFFGFPVYLKYKRQPKNYITDLVFEIKSKKVDPLEHILSSDPGKFLLSHLGVDTKLLLDNAKATKLEFKKEKFEGFGELTDYLLRKNIWSVDFLRKQGISKEDFQISASWWDDKRKEETVLGGQDFGRSGIATELLFGYTPTLNKYSVDLSAPRSFSHRLIGREQVVSRMERTLTAGKSVALIGQPGVGKKTVTLEFAHRAATGQLGAGMAFQRVLEFDYNSFLSGAKDLNKKKAELSALLEEAGYAGNIILMIRDIQRLTHADVEGNDFTDIFETHLEKRKLKIIAVTTPVEYERFVAPNMRLRKYLDTVEVNPPSKKQALQILIESARNWERKKPLTIRINALRKILDESDRYITETPFPEKVLELLDAVITYVEKEGKNAIDINDVNTVLAEKTGISFAKLTKTEKVKLSNLEKIIHERLIGQDAAVKLIAKSLRAKTVGVSKSKRPIGSFLFLGPTGVGKTETAKVLAKVYYGSEDKILRFDMAEFGGREGLERLIGSQSQNRPGALVTDVKNNPASLLLLDEIEKSSPEIYNLFLTLLDEGSMTDAFGKKINGRHLFVIGTSNAGAEYIRQLVQKGVKGADLQSQVLEHVMQKGIFSPEFINRFDGVVVYEPLGSEELTEIAKLMLSDLADALKKKGVYLTYDDAAAQKLAEDGYDPAFGARPMRRIVDLNFGDLIGKAILSGEVEDGDKVKLVPQKGKLEYKLEKVDKNH